MCYTGGKKNSHINILTLTLWLYNLPLIPNFFIIRLNDPIWVSLEFLQDREQRELTGDNN